MRPVPSSSFPTLAALVALPLLHCASTATAAVTPAVTPEQNEFFENKIRPIFANHCLECHSAEKGKTKGSFSMDSREEILKGGETGSALVPGDAKGSTLIKAVTWEDDLQMPPKKKLSDEQIADLKKWVAMGAPDPRDPSKSTKKDKKAHWAFQPVQKQTPPAVKNAAWCVNKLDNFVLAKLEEKQMLPAPQAEKETLLRRAYFDLVGLPPSPREIEAFVRDPNPDRAYAAVIDRLLASPAYGERWGRHWMDTARYSDTTGDLTNQADRISEYRYPYAWTYREWVIKALNNDLPYDQFVMQQLAADKIPNNPKENLAALGLMTVGQRFPMKDDIINDRIDVIGRGFLGLTIACARCHDHKFDPVTTADYYALRGIFASCAEPKEGPLIAGDPQSPTFLKYQSDLAKMEEKAFAEFYKIQREYSDKMRKNGEVLFEAALFTQKSATAEQNTRANELLKEHKLDKDPLAVVNSTVMSSNRLRPSDEIYGPFVKLATVTTNREAVIGSMLNGKDKAKYNSEVIAFLKEQPSLPSDPHQVAVLVGKFFAKSEPKTAALYAEFMDKTKDVSNSPDKAAMEVAVFPLRLLPAAEMSVERMMEEANRSFPNPKIRGMLATGADLAGINKFKITFKGGPVRAMVLEDLPQATDSPIYIRGNAPKPGDKVKTVPRRFVEVLSDNQKPVAFKEGSGRLELAKSIASKTNPLTARVIVNRVWMHHFGEGLVRTPDDLGNQAGLPTHPELLDFLANWFVEDFGPQKPAWSLKALHKAIMLTRTYQQSSNTAFKGGTVAYDKVDPANTFLWRANVRRLDFEAFRDSLISMAGIMDHSLGGQSFNVNEEPYSFRRSVYSYIDRAGMPDLLMQFDMANPDQPNSKRTTTIVPQQALFLMNSSFVAQIVQNIVKRPEIVQAVREGSDRGLTAVYRVVLQRIPTASERERAMKFLLTENKQQATVKVEAAKIAQDAAKLADKKAKTAQAQSAKSAFQAIQNEGEMVQRVAFSPWETLVQALLFSNEAAYVN
jgi:mono/diheme cytochrome c family protein